VDYRNHQFYQTIAILPTVKALPGYNDVMDKLNRSYSILNAAVALLAGIALFPGCNIRKAVPGQEVWAEVDDQPIYREQVERLYHGRSAQGTDASTAEEAASFKLNVLNELIITRSWSCTLPTRASRFPKRRSTPKWGN
jgi:hypothetical protein